MTELLTTTGDVIDALGGDKAVEELTGRTPQLVDHDRRSGRFAAKTYLVMTTALRARGLSAPASLWGQIEAQGHQDTAPTQNEAVPS